MAYALLLQAGVSLVARRHRPLVVLAVTDAWWMWWIVFPLMGIFGKHRSGGGWCSGGRHTRDDAGRAYGRTGHDADRETITV